MIIRGDHSDDRSHSGHCDRPSTDHSGRDHSDDGDLDQPLHFHRTMLIMLIAIMLIAMTML